MTTSAPPKVLIDKKHVAQDYGICISTQDALAAKGEFCPALRVGKKIYYRRSELEAWLDSRRIVTSHKGVESLEP